MEKIAFAHNLRGIAALLVVFSHLAGNFFLKSEMVMALLIVPYVAPSVPTLASFHHFFPPYFFGELGVAIFF